MHQYIMRDAVRRPYPPARQTSSPAGTGAFRLRGTLVAEVRMIEKCPQCGESTDGGKWDGWDCKGCKYALPSKHRKAYAKLERVKPKKK